MSLLNFIFKLDIICIYISNAIHFSLSPIPHPPPLAFVKVLALPTTLSISVPWQSSTLGKCTFTGPLMADNAILCSICNQSHGSLRVCSLVGVLVPRSSGGFGQLIMFFPWGCKHFQLLQSFL